MRMDPQILTIQITEGYKRVKSIMKPNLTNPKSTNSEKSEVNYCEKVFLLLLILFMACSGSEDTADTTAENEDVLVPPPAPILENPTESVKLLSRRFLFYEGMRTNTYFGLPGVERLKRENPKLITPEEDTPMVTSVGEPTNVYRVRNGHLTQEEIVSQEPLYHLVWVDLNDEIVLMNVLENRIKYIPYDEAMDQAFDNLTPEQKAREDELWLNTGQHGMHSLKTFKRN